MWDGGGGGGGCWCWWGRESGVKHLMSTAFSSHFLGCREDKVTRVFVIILPQTQTDRVKAENVIIGLRSHKNLISSPGFLDHKPVGRMGAASFAVEHLTDRVFLCQPFFTHPGSN